MFSTETIYEVVIFSVGDTKAGTKMGKLQLRDTGDSSLLNCILWEETLNRLDPKLFRSGNLLRIVSGSFNEKYNNCLVSAFELIKEAKLGLDTQERDTAFKQLSNYIDSIQNPDLKKFVSEIYIQYEDKIKISPAAKLMHHNYVGGLMVHILECLAFADVNFPLFTAKLDKDEVIAACLLHDIGKIFEYTIDTETGLIDYDEEFRKDWLTHSQYVFSICMNAGFKTIAKMIAAHHGRAEWGAIIDLNEKDLESELYLVHHLDDLSAKFGKINVSML